MPTIETERLVLRSFEKKDIEPFSHVMGDPDVMHFSWHGPYDKNSAELLILRSLAQEIKHRLGFLAVTDREIFLGYCGLFWGTVDGEFVPQLSFRLAKKHWDQGYGEEAAGAVLHYAFDVLNIPHIISLIDKDNERSVHLAEKLGGVRVKGITYHGLPHELYRYSIS